MCLSYDRSSVGFAWTDFCYLCEKIPTNYPEIFYSSDGSFVSVVKEDERRRLIRENLFRGIVDSYKLGAEEISRLRLLVENSKWSF